ncbi:MAG: alpha/beta hydrolase [Bacteroidia bacterium]
MLTKKRLKKLAIFLLLSFVIWVGVGYFAAQFLMKTYPKTHPEIVKIGQVKVQNVNIRTSDKLQLSAWYLDNASPRAIILLSGIRANRLAQISRAEFYLKKGFSVLMPDLRGTGESEGERVTFGWEERKDVLACVKYLQEKGFSHIAADGQSLGAATIVYAHQEFQDFDFVVLESCYDNITHAFQHRIEHYPLPYFLFRPVVYFTENALQTQAAHLAPDSLIRKVKCPTLLLAGDEEQQIPLSETLTLYKNCGANPKILHIFKGAKHENFHNRFAAEYEQQVSTFLENLPNLSKEKIANATKQEQF